MFYKKSKAKVGNAYKWFPRAHIVGKPVDTQQLAEYVSRQCTVSPADVHAVIRSLPDAMAFYMSNGHSVRLDGLGSFFYKLSCAGRGVDSPEEVSIEQIVSVRVQFIPARMKNGFSFIRSLLGTNKQELVEWSSKERKE